MKKHPNKLQFISLIFLSILIVSAQAQVAEYRMENNLNDFISNHDGTYIESGVQSSNTPIFSNGQTGKKIVLDPIQGIELPLSLNNQLDTMTSIQIEMDINLSNLGTDLNNDRGWKYLLSIAAYDGLNGPGISLFTRHDIFDSNPSYDIVFSYADGGFDLGVPEHPGHDETTIGFASEGENVSISIILDFENNQFTSLVNGNYTNKFFDNDGYDMNIVKASIKQYIAYIGWAKFAEQQGQNIFSSTVEFDNVKFFSPREPGNFSVLITALNAMKNHSNGLQILNNTQLEGFLVDIFLNYHGNYAGAETEIFDFISAYESNYDPVLSDRSILPFRDLIPETQALIFVQQKIHDNQFSPSNVSNMAGVKFEAAEVFPGPVSNTAPRVQNATVEINATHKVFAGARLAADTEDTKRPTGYYAAPGEIITVTIPNNLTNKGLTAMVGAHDADHSFLQASNRFVRISKDFPLTTTSTQIANPFGGAIYIKFPEGSELGWFTITIDDAVKSPYFSTRPGRETSLSSWQTELANNHVQWVDMESEKYMMTLPLPHVISISNPAALMDSLDRIQDAYRYAGGRPFERSRAEYFLVDARLPNVAFGTGYPQVIGDNFAPFGPFGSFENYPTIILQPDFHKTDFVTTLHESGHLALHPTLPLEVESIIHINASYLYNSHYNLPLDTAFKYSAFERLTLDQAAMDWMIANNFRDNIPMSCDPLAPAFECDEVRYQHRGHAKYVDMAKLFGWQSVHGMNKVFYEEWKLLSNFTNNGVQPDDIIAAASAATGVNMAPLFHFWGLHPSPTLTDQLSYMPESMDILNLLNYYKTIIPANTQAYQPWHNILRPSKGPPHFIRYDYYISNYDNDNFAQNMEDQIDFLIATYFGNSPCVQNLQINQIVGSGVYTVQDWITASTLIHPLSTVSMSANNYTELLPNFEIQLGAQLLVDTNGCIP